MDEWMDSAGNAQGFKTLVSALSDTGFGEELDKRAITHLKKGHCNPKNQNREVKELLQKNRMILKDVLTYYLITGKLHFRQKNVNSTETPGGGEITIA